MKLANILAICDALCNLLPFLRFKKREKHPWRRGFSLHTLLKVSLHGSFSRVLNCRNGTKVAQSDLYLTER